MKRVLALVAAVAMVVGAVVLRARLDDSGSGGATGGGSGSGSSGSLRIGCIEELRAACEALAAADDDVTVVVEPAGKVLRTLSSASAEPPSIDAWLTFAPLAGVVAIERQRALADPALGEPGEVLARSELGVSIWSERADVLAVACGGAVTWRCLGERAGASWGDLGGNAAWGTLRPTHPSPVETGVGLLTLGHIGASYFDRSEFSTNDVRGDSGFSGFFARLERAVAPSARPFEDQLLLGVAKYDAVGTVRAVAEPAIARSRYSGGQLRVVVPAPAAFAEVVLVPVAGAPAAGKVGGARGDVRKALVAAGWSTPAAGGTGASSGLPDDGVLIALRTLFEEVS